MWACTPVRTQNDEAPLRSCARAAKRQVQREMASRYLYREAGFCRGAPTGHLQHGTPYQVSDLVMGLASPGALPCPERAPAYDLHFSKRAGDGHLIAFGTEFGRLVIADTRAESAVQRDHSGPVGGGAWSQADGGWRSICSGAPSLDRDADTGCRPPVRGGVSGSSRWGGSRRWGVRQPEVVVQYRAVVNCIFDLGWTHDDTRIALACGDAKIRVHDIETRAEVVVLSGHNGSVKSVSVNPVDNDILLSGSRDGSFALWDTRIRHDTPEISVAHRMEKTEYLALATAPANRVPTRHLSPVEQVYRANINMMGRDPNRLAQCEQPRSFLNQDTSGGDAPSTLAARNANRGYFMGPSCPETVTAVYWMPDGEKFLTAGQDGIVKLWDTRYAVRPFQAVGASSPAASRGSPRAGKTTTSPSASAARPNGRAVPASLVRGGGGGGSGGRKGRVTSNGGILGRVTGGEAVGEEAGPGGGVAGIRPYGVASVHACDDGSRVAVCTVKNHVSVYSYASGTLRTLGAFTGINNASSYYIKARLSPDGSLLASGSTYDAVCLWQVDCPGLPLARLLGHVNEVNGVDWCRAEPLKLATCSDDETVRTWTINPIRVARHSAARRQASACSDCAVPAAFPRLAAGETGDGYGYDHYWGAGGGGAWGSTAPAPAVQRVSGRTLAQVRQREGFGGGGGGGPYAPLSSPGGKFGPGRAHVGESSFWRWGDPGRGDVGDRERGLGGSGARGRRRKRPGWRQSEGRGGALGLMHVRLPRMSTITSAVPPACAEGVGNGGPGGVGWAVDAVFSPRSPNKTTAASVAQRTLASDARSCLEDALAAAGGAKAGDASDSAASYKEPPPPAGAIRVNENMAPDSKNCGGLAGVSSPPRTDSGQEPLAEGGMDAAAVDETADLRKGSSPPVFLNGLPRGRSSAARPGDGLGYEKGSGLEGRGQKNRQRKPRQQQQQQQLQLQLQHDYQEQKGGLAEEKQERRGPVQKKLKQMRGAKQSAATGVTGRESPLARKNPTLMAFWQRGRGNASISS